MKMVIAGGGTGGHIFPAIAIAEEFLSREPNNQVLMIGSEEGLEEQFFAEQKLEYQLLRTGKFTGESLGKKVRTGFKLLFATFQAIKVIRQFNPQFLLGVGGYASVPAVLAGFILRIPRAIQEQNSYPGLANLFLARLSHLVFLSFESAKQYFKGVKPEQFVISGNPLRKKVIEELMRPLEPEEHNTRFQLLVVGGSQGARRLNKLMIDVAEYLLPIRDKLKIVHMSGTHDQYDLILSYSKKGLRAKVYQFIDEIGKELKRADLVISRAGAGAIFEIALAGKPSILIPYPFAANNHQLTNAQYLAQEGAALLFTEEELKDSKKFADAILELYQDPSRREEMGRRARSLAKPEAGKVIVDRIYKLIEEKK